MSPTAPYILTQSHVNSHSVSCAVSVPSACQSRGLTISIDVHSTGIALPVFVCVCLVRVVVVGAVVTAVSHIISVIVILGWVVMEWTVVPVIGDLVVVIVIIAGIANPVLVIVFLPRVGKVGAVVLKRRRHS